MCLRYSLRSFGHPAIGALLALAAGALCFLWMDGGGTVEASRHRT
jgi:hypothetical protein